MLEPGWQLNWVIVKLRQGNYADVIQIITKLEMITQELSIVLDVVLEFAQKKHA